MRPVETILENFVEHKFGSSPPLPLYPSRNFSSIHVSTRVFLLLFTRVLVTLSVGVHEEEKERERDGIDFYEINGHP